MQTRKGAQLFMLSMVVAAVHALTVETPKKKIEVARGNNVTLLCTYQSSAVLQSGDFASWIKKSSEAEIIDRYFDNGETREGQGYEGRVSFPGDTNNGNLSITLNKVTMDDNGTYECSVRIRNDLPSIHAAMDLLVLVAPSEPDCKIIGSAEYGHNINLTCNSNEGSPKPEYSWQSYNPQNNLRTLVGTVSGGLLILKNISADTSGYYICLSKNNVGEAKCNLTVSVMPPSMNFALYAGVIGGVVAAVIIIGVLAYCCCCRNRKDKDYEMTERENEYQPPEKVPIRIRGPADEEVENEEEEQDEAVAAEDEEREKRTPIMPHHH